VTTTCHHPHTRTGTVNTGDGLVSGRWCDDCKALSVDEPARDYGADQEWEDRRAGDRWEAFLERGMP
jgi:hypothetical protein